MAETAVTLNVGTGGAAVATFVDSSTRQHEEVIIQTQSGSADPVSVSAANPLPVVNASALPAGSNAIGTVAINAALPAGANTIGAVTQPSGATYGVVGNVPAGGADAGNGVKVSGVYNSAAP